MTALYALLFAAAMRCDGVGAHTTLGYTRFRCLRDDRPARVMVVCGGDAIRATVRFRDGSWVLREGRRGDDLFVGPLCGGFESNG